MKRYLIAYLVMLVLFPVLDGVWFVSVAGRLYKADIGQLIYPSFRIAPALIFYALYSAGVLVFVVAPGLARPDWPRTLLLAALFGVVAYSAYDLTNLATLKGFTLRIGLLDMAWGATATAITASFSRLAAQTWG